VAGSGPIDFDPVIEIPDHPFDAARVYLGVLAYPERGAGQLDGLGVPFGEALWQYVVWNGRQAKGLRWIRDKFGDPNLKPPRKRDFEGALNRGMRRIERRIAAFDVIGNQMVNGFLNAGVRAHRLAAEGRRDEAFLIRPGAKFAPIRPELWEEATPSARRIVRRNLGRWSERFALNDTGPPADPSQKAKDIIRRGFLQSRPVLHMAHGLNRICAEVGPTLEGWDDWDWLLVLLWNPDAWVWEAIRHATIWRLLSGLRQMPQLAPEQMIELVPPKVREITPPAWIQAVGR
jgi:hypothetical protein